MDSGSTGPGAEEGAYPGASQQAWGQPGLYQGAPFYPASPGAQQQSTMPTGTYPGPMGPPAPYPYGQPGPWSTPLPGYAPVAVAAPPPKKRRTGLWITLAVLVTLLALGGGGGAFAYTQYRAPQDAVVKFCNLLQRQDYVAAYAQLSSGLKAQYSQQDFSDEVQALDQAEGKVTACQQSTTGVYSYTLFGNTATVATTMTRGLQGTLQGALHLANEGGAWKIDRLDTSLLGVHLGALKTAIAFCAALRAGNASAAYALFGSTMQNQVAQADFADGMQIHQQVDGAVTSCAPVAVAQDNSDTSAALTLGVTRATLGARQGAMRLDVEGGSWNIGALDDKLSGTDLRPLGLANSYCADLKQGNLKALYDLFSSGFRSHYSYAQVKGFFTLDPGFRFIGCNPHLGTYKVSDTAGTFDVDVLIVDAKGNQYVAPTTLYFVLEGQDWKIDDFQVH